MYILNLLFAVSTLICLFLYTIESAIGHELTMILQIILGVLLLKAGKIEAFLERRRLKAYVKNAFDQAKKRGAIIPIVILPRKE